MRRAKIKSLRKMRAIVNKMRIPTTKTAVQRNLTLKNKRRRISRRKGRKTITKEKENRRNRIEVMDTEEETTEGIAQKTTVRRSKSNQNENTRRKVLITDTEMRI